MITKMENFQYIMKVFLITLGSLLGLVVLTFGSGTLVYNLVLGVTEDNGLADGFTLVWEICLFISLGTCLLAWESMDN